MENGEKTFVPRPQEELDRLKELVKSAVGFSEERGDKIEVASVAFQSEPMPAGEGILGVVGRWAPAVLLRLLAVGFAAAMLLYVVRPLVLGLAARPASLGGAAARIALSGPEAAVAQLTQENAVIAQQDPERAARLVREWLHEAGPASEQV